MTEKKPAGGGETVWQFIDEAGSFEWQNPTPANELYFPLCNEAGMMASITPHLHGDATTGWHSFLRRPLVMADLHNTRSTRNFWIFNSELGAYSIVGRSAGQIGADDPSITVRVSGTFLAHTLERIDPTSGIRSEITSFCPVADDKVEIHRVRLTNIGSDSLDFAATTSFPLYARSADNLRDHNHWTSLSHRAVLIDRGLVVTPEMLHDEGGHRPNVSSYFVLAFDGDGGAPIGQFPSVREFIGEGNLEWPDAVTENRTAVRIAGQHCDGEEVIGALRFATRRLKPGECCEYVVIEGATEQVQSVEGCAARYGSAEKVAQALQENNVYWRDRVERIRFESAHPRFDQWMRWVSLQPILRKIYGNSFLPHFDYGRGGRGWRDLWQDCLALLLQNPEEMKESLVSYFDGVRIDGSNATIINKALGEFVADRNHVSRVWMDHGVWPYCTLRLYIDQTGDFDVLLAERTYWRDHQICRAKARDAEWRESNGTKLGNRNGEVYTGTILEHILVQHLTCFCNVGEHNHMKLEDADWNDLLDMANDRGESVPFSAFYGRNLIDIADLIDHLARKCGLRELLLASDLLRLTGMDEPLDMESPQAKRQRLQDYFKRVHTEFSGEKRTVVIAELSAELRRMGNWVLEHVRNEEWVESASGHGFFNGYYNNDGIRVDGDDVDGPRMNLTAQTFAILSGAATEHQVRRSYSACRSILSDPCTAGLRLTTPLGPHRWNLGRGFAVVYGEKETGGTFNHMVVMFANGLYRRGFVQEGYGVLLQTYGLATNARHAKIYPGIPEYINCKGQGKYHYLSGSASWFLMTMLTQVFGVRGELGDLVLDPKLLVEQFDAEGQATAWAYFSRKRIRTIYENRDRLEFDEYAVVEVQINDEYVEIQRTDCGQVRISKEQLEARLLSNQENVIHVRLERR